MSSNPIKANKNTPSYPEQQAPRRLLEEEELKRLNEEGAICARDLLDLATIEHMREALEEVISGEGVLGTNAPSMEDQGFHADAFAWKLHDGFRDLALFSALPRLAEQVLGCKQVNFFYEQFFTKRAGSPIKTPWHQDITFWPVAGTQIVSFWITLDPVNRESSGLEFVRGSHHWDQRYQAITPNYDPYMMDSDLPPAPDFSKRRDEFDLLGWDMEPGDVLIFGPTVCHGSAGNASNKQDRRALAFRYSGDDVVFAPRHATMPLLWRHGLEPGDRLSGPLFPQVRPHILPEEIATRWLGPEPPSTESIEAFLRQMQNYELGSR